MELLPRSIRRFDSEVAQHRSQYDIHLHVREHRTHAAPGTAAVRKPAEARRLGADEALRIEAVRIREQFRVSVQPGDADDDGVPARDGPFAEFEGGRVDVSAGGVDDRPLPLHLEDRGLT